MNWRTDACPPASPGASDFAREFKTAMDLNEKLIGIPATATGNAEEDAAADELAGAVEKVAVKEE